MIKMMDKKFYIKKYEGDDCYSYAVFQRGCSCPIVTGCGRCEAYYHKRMLEENSKKKENK